jgi:aspartate dehydrogenase
MREQSMHKLEGSSDMRIAIVGLGAVGKSLASALDAGMPGMRLVAVATRSEITTQTYLKTLRNTVSSVAIEELPEVADLIIECAPAHLLPTIAEPVLKAGKTLVVLSVGALLSNTHLIRLAEQFNGRILVPSGAVGGLDIIAAAAEGTIHTVKLVTRKPMQSLTRAVGFIEQGIPTEEMTIPVCVFSGTARQAVMAFPANINVAATLALAGIGGDRTVVEIWADPQAQCITHQIEIDSDIANIKLTIMNRPSDNPRTSRIVAPSVIALLKKIRAPLRIGC